MHGPTCVEIYQDLELRALMLVDFVVINTFASPFHSMFESLLYHGLSL